MTMVSSKLIGNDAFNLIKATSTIEKLIELEYYEYTECEDSPFKVKNNKDWEKYNILYETLENELKERGIHEELRGITFEMDVLKTTIIDDIAYKSYLKGFKLAIKLIEELNEINK